MTARQYQYSAVWKSDSVYTPGFVLDGREWRERSVPVSSSDKPGALKVSITNDKVSATFNAAKNVDLHAATLGFDLNTKVTAGENNGRNLRQDFVVLLLKNEKMVDGKAEVHLTVEPRASAIAAWITAPNQLGADPGRRRMVALNEGYRNYVVR